MDVLDDGTVVFELAGKEQRLTPSVGACRKLNALHGAIGITAQRCSNLDFDTICKVLQIGMDLNPRQAKDMLPEAVYDEGLIAMSAPCVRFIHVVSNGGAAPKDADEEKDTGDVPLARESV